MQDSEFKKEITYMKAEVKNIKMGSSSTVSSEASTGWGSDLGLVHDRRLCRQGGAITGFQGISSSRSGLLIFTQKII